MVVAARPRPARREQLGVRVGLGDAALLLTLAAEGVGFDCASASEIKEVLARLDVLARRGPDRRLRAGGLVLDPVAHSARTDQGRVLLTPTEFRMLAAITSRPGEVVRRRSVVAAAWPDGAMVSENTVDSFLRKIRAKLDEIDSPTIIETVRGVGFTTAERP